MRAAVLVLGLAFVAGEASAQEAGHVHEMAPAPQAATPAATPDAAPPSVAADDWAADRYFPPQAMGRARDVLHNEHGGGSYSMFLADIAELQSGQAGPYRWEAEAWFGGDINRLVLKSEGEGARHGEVESAEVQALYSHAINPYFNAQAGVRQDLRPHARTYVTAGLEGLAPYFFEVDGAVFLSNRGELTARATGSYDLRLTQRLILQPRLEVNLAAQAAEDMGVGAGLSEAEAGLRLRYEVSRQVAPYVGASCSGRFGRSARLARAAGDDPRSCGLVVGLRTWF